LKTLEAITLDWTVLPRPPHTQPSTFIFPPLRSPKNVCGVKFKIDNEVISAMRTWLHEQDKEWYRQGIHALLSRWRKAAEVERDTVEKTGFGDKPSHLNMC
jgi:hypothetical protein